jgi:hypothetical protein
LPNFADDADVVLLLTLPCASPIVRRDLLDRAVTLLIED